MTLVKFGFILVAVFVLCPVGSSAIFSNDVVIPFTTVPWSEKTTVYYLPEPFGKVTVSVKRNDKKITGITVFNQGHELEFRDDLLKGLKNAKGPSLSYKSKRLRKHSEINFFELSFQYGYPKIFRVPEAGCKPVSVWNFVTFVVTKNYHVKRKDHNLIKEYEQNFPSKCESHIGE
jgi:hypothetical protein